MDTPTPSSGERRSRTWLAWVLVAAAVVAAAVVVLVVVLDDDGSVQAPAPTTALAADTDGPDDTRPDIRGVTENFSGQGDGTTEVFEVSDNWELRWEASRSFEVELMREGGVSRGTIVTSDGGEGAIFVVEAGTFYLEVLADGEWRLEIITRI